MSQSTLFLVLFNIFIVAMLALDLGVFHRRARAIHFKEAVGWSIFWITLALLFAGLLYTWHGPHASLTFLTGYLVEQSLSVDNLFVFLLLFRYFKAPRQQQHRVLFWGILGALIMRGVFIALGLGLIRRFHWIVYVFGAFLAYSGLQMLREAGIEVHPERNPVLKLLRRWMPITHDYVEGKFLVRRERAYLTPLLVVLAAVETTDVLFAVDSIPAVLAITTDGFLVYTSNVFAVLGLRSMFFTLAGMMEVFHHLHYGLAAILVFVGGKMLLADYLRSHWGYEMPISLALSVVAGLVALSVLASLIFPVKPKPQEQSERQDE